MLCRRLLAVSLPARAVVARQLTSSAVLRNKFVATAEAVREARTKIHEISAPALRYEITKDVTHDQLVVLDVRESNAWTSGYLPESVSLPLSQLTAESAAKLLPSKDKRIVVYCNAGNASAVATAALVSFGYKNVSNLVGGIEEWKYGQGFSVLKKIEAEVKNFGPTVRNAVVQ